MPDKRARRDGPADAEFPDPRLAAARYRVDRLNPEGEKPQPEADNAGQASMDQRAQYVETVIQQAIRRGDFDNLPGSGKPLANLGQASDPDWWIRQKIEREAITGLGPPALTLRAENAALDARLAGAVSERAVREILQDFNHRVIEARRQLLGGPPVVTPTRDIDEEVERWHERRAARLRTQERERADQAAAQAALSWRERRRARRAR
ncbi:J-domain-containing protein [Glaciibacter sp. 2TAF33]|uniref:DnaJ family domain-containing protein n=1 Tax=Glaciibacter sp. 2TAF33 TaxID=3233015 RepID=UPI003F927D5C